MWGLSKHTYEVLMMSTNQLNQNKWSLKCRPASCGNNEVFYLCLTPDIVIYQPICQLCWLDKKRGRHSRGNTIKASLPVMNEAVELEYKSFGLVLRSEIMKVKQTWQIWLKCWKPRLRLNHRDRVRRCWWLHPPSSRSSATLGSRPSAGWLPPSKGGCQKHRSRSLSGCPSHL